MAGARMTLEQLPPALRAQAEAQIAGEVRAGAVLESLGVTHTLPPHPPKSVKFVQDVSAELPRGYTVRTGTTEVCRFTIPGAPMGKPRMTQRDKWAKRPAVLRYRDWADRARAAAPADLPTAPTSVSWVAYLPMPKSWPKKQRLAMEGALHKAKPDRDNIDKAVLDSLWPQDSSIATGTITKFWEDALGPRLEVEVSA